MRLLTRGVERLLVWPRQGSGMMTRAERRPCGPAAPARVELAAPAVQATPIAARQVLVYRSRNRSSGSVMAFTAR